MKRIAIVTSTRAEYGLLKPIIIKLRKGKHEVKLVVTGTHLSDMHGKTIKEIEEDKIYIDKKIDIFGEKINDVSYTISKAIILFSEYFKADKPEAVLVLGDRYETLAVCIAAMVQRIPIIHIHGGETTEGAIDEAIRHSITKMSCLHFTSTDLYRKRVIQLGENPKNVYNVGALGVENALKQDLLTKADLEENLGIKMDRYVIGTFHPVTLEEKSEKDLYEILKAIDKFRENIYIFTKANADREGILINKILEDYAAEHKNFYLYDSLGMVRYLSAIKYASFVIGNSSSGIIEAPSFNVPTIDIGNRQKGRIRANSVIHCDADEKEIIDAIKKANSKDFREKIKATFNPYGMGNTSDKIVSIIEEYLDNDKFEIKKKFFDIEFELD